MAPRERATIFGSIERRGRERKRNRGKGASVNPSEQVKKKPVRERAMGKNVN